MNSTGTVLFLEEHHSAILLAFSRLAVFQDIGIVDMKGVFSIYFHIININFSQKTPTDSWNIPQTLNYLFRKEFLSYLCFGVPGVC